MPDALLATALRTVVVVLTVLVTLVALGVALAAAVRLSEWRRRRRVVEAITDPAWTSRADAGSGDPSSLPSPGWWL